MKETNSNNYKEHVFALIMAGGGGTRLWPKSLEKTPKQFLKLFHGKTLTEITADRISKFVPWERIFVATSSESYAKEIRKLLPELKPENLVIEPVRRDSGPAHALSTAVIYKRDPDAVIINAATDHLVRPEIHYKHVMLAASSVAYEGDYLVAVGIRPTYPHTGLGHLHRGRRFTISEDRVVYKLKRFVEKPELSLAKRYTASGNYFWNANMFVWRADTFLNAVKKHAPKIWEVLSKITEKLGTEEQQKIIDKEFPKMPKISVEYSVCEKVNNFLMLVADFEWTDIGDWNELWKNLHKDQDGNVYIDGEEENGRVYNLDSSDVLVHTDGRPIALIDVDNIVVVDTKEALLICSKSKAQNVKKLVEILKKENRTELL